TAVIQRVDRPDPPNGGATQGIDLGLFRHRPTSRHLTLASFSHGQHWVVARRTNHTGLGGGRKSAYGADGEYNDTCGDAHLFLLTPWVSALQHAPPLRYPFEDIAQSRP